MKYRIRRTSEFKKSVKLMEKRHYDMSLLEETVRILATGDTLPERYKNHQLKGKKYKEHWECHILPDWLLVYKIDNGELILTLTDTGTHSDLF